MKKLFVLGLFGLLLSACSHDLPKGNVPEVVPTPTYGAGGETTMNYQDYSASAYQQARSEGKIILIYFYANWCPTCRLQIPENDKAFAELSSDPAVAIFVSNFNDSEETGEDKALQREFDVPYQHTFLILNSAGEVSYKYTGQLTAEEIVLKVNEVKE